MTYNELCYHAIKTLSIDNQLFEDFRPASPLFVPELKEQIPNAIIIWLKSGQKIIYIEKGENI